LACPPPPSSDQPPSDSPGRGRVWRGCGKGAGSRGGAGRQGGGPRGPPPAAPPAAGSPYQRPGGVRGGGAGGGRAHGGGGHPCPPSLTAHPLLTVGRGSPSPRRARGGTNLRARGTSASRLQTGFRFMNAEAAVWGSPSPGVGIYGLKPSKAVLGYGDAPGGGGGHRPGRGSGGGAGGGGGGAGGPRGPARGRAGEGGKGMATGSGLLGICPATHTCGPPHACSSIGSSPRGRCGGGDRGCPGPGTRAPASLLCSGGPPAAPAPTPPGSLYTPLAHTPGAWPGRRVLLQVLHAVGDGDPGALGGGTGGTDSHPPSTHKKRPKSEGWS